MFGLSLEKLVLVAVLAAFVLGPQRLPLYTAKLARFVRSFRRFLDAAKQNAEAELGIPLDKSTYQVDLRQYDPRSIIRDALHEPGGAAAPKERSHGVEVPVHASGTTPQPEQHPASPHVGLPLAPLPTGPAAAGTTTTVEEGGGAATSDVEQAREDADVRSDPAAPVTRPQWVVTGGSSGHPRRVLVAEPLEHDPPQPLR